MPRRKPIDPDRSSDLPLHYMERQIGKAARWAQYHRIPQDEWMYRSSHMVAPGSYESVEGVWRTIRLGDQWGGKDITGFFRKHITIPSTHAVSTCALEIWMDGGETQVSVDGRPWQGLDWNRSIVPIGEIAETRKEIAVELEAYIINYPYDARRADERELHQFARADLLLIDPEIEKFVTGAKLVLDTVRHLWETDGDPELEEFLTFRLEEVCRVLGPDLSSREAASAAVARASELLEERIFRSPAFSRNGSLTIHAHSHLDILYLWPMKETFRKNCRTVTNMLSIMRENPGFIYSQSQPFLYEKLQEMYPDTFRELKARIAEGRWEVIGAMYVEPDANIPGAESMVRQLLFGKRYLRREFGIDAETCLLPDVFGLMYTLPQILRKAGVRFFVSNKMNIWNDTNDFPYDNFRWRGPDGSEVVAHFPATHFAQELTPATLRTAWDASGEKSIVGESLFIYGHGDGGGGPTREMAAASMVADRIPGMPATRIEFAVDFLRRLEEKRDALPVWDDELYLEAHRGTYTTKGNLKRLNRKAEILYRDAEIVSSLASLFGGPYRQDHLNEGWKLLLVNQFHDTLPGSHCTAAVPDILEAYEKIHSIGEAVLQQAVSHIADSIVSEAVKGVSPVLLMINTLSWVRDDLVSLPAGVHMEPNNSLQEYDGQSWLYADSIPPLGWKVAGNESPGLEAEDAATFIGDELRTPWYVISFAEDGTIAQIIDREFDRIVLSSAGNCLLVFEDDPGRNFSAWNIAYHLEDFQYPVTLVQPWRMAANGPLFAVMKSSWRVLNSTIHQEMWVYANSRRIDFKTTAEWRDSRKLMKVAFPLKVRAREAVYDLPFGNISRPTHRNTSWEAAKYEVCGHKWADISEGNYGVALLNDCKYGYDARENVLRLTLLRSPVRPDAVSDLGQHTFTYSLLPHAGSWRDAEVDRRAYELNVPAVSTMVPTVQAGGEARIPATFSLFGCDVPFAVTETVKQAEDGEGLIVRSYENHGCRGMVEYRCSRRINRAAETNLLEEESEEILLENGRSLHMRFAPYEIKTCRIQFD